MSIDEILFSIYKSGFPYNGFVVSEDRVNKVLRQNDKVAIFGTGLAAKQAYNFCVEAKLNLVCFVDDYCDGLFYGFPIIKREAIVQMNIDVILAGYGQKGNLNFEDTKLVNLHFLEPYTFSEKEVNKALFLSAEYACSAGVDGDIAEFGTNTGRSSSVLAYAISRFSDTKKLFCFDSFEGLPIIKSEVDRKHKDVIDGVWKASYFCDLRDEELATLLGRLIPRDRTIIYKGWFIDSLPTVDLNIRLALVHIDSDLYESAIDVLEYIFDKGMVSDGCVILFDDFNCSCASNELGERKAWMEILKKYKILYSDGGWYGCVGWRFIVHSYCRNLNV